MELEKSESVLGNLYTLRGGLSAISVEYDKAQSADAECYEKLDGIAKRFVRQDDLPDDEQGTVEYAQWICSGGLEAKLQQYYNFELDCINNRKIEERKIFDDTDRYIHIYNNEHKQTVKLFVFMSLLFALAIGLYISLIFIFRFEVQNGTRHNQSAQALANAISAAKTLTTILSFLFSVVPITALVFMTKAIRQAKEEHKSKNNLISYMLNLQHKREAETDRFNREMQAAQEERNAVQEKYNRLFEALPAAYEEARALLNQRNATFSPLTESCNIYHKALTTQFTYLLDERDWQHLDLVIYQLETRRADSIKEALQLVDRELQTERLENSIIAATKSICFTLAHGFAALQNSININCAKICDGLVAMSANINAALSMQSMQLAGISEQLADLTNSANVSNALQAKANETSARLVEDVAALRYFNTDMYV